MISLNNQSLLFSPCVQHEGFAFIYMEDERDAEDAISRLDGIDFGRKGRRIKVEWTKVSRRGDGRVLTR
jgi:splicing factor, arginine/serine-rich 4/5/6